jgi:DnaJ family protein C protein 13
MHDNYDIRQEQINKASLLSSDKFIDSLLDILTINVVREARLTIQLESD